MTTRRSGLIALAVLALVVFSDAVPLRAKPKGKPKPTFAKEPVDKRTDKVGGYNCCRLCPMLFYGQRLMPWLKKGKSLLEQDSSISLSETDSTVSTSLSTPDMLPAPILHYVHPGSSDAVHPAFDNEHIRPLPMSSFLQEVQRLHGMELERIDKKKGKKPHRLCCNVCAEPYTEDAQYPDMLYYTAGIPANALLRKDKTGRVFKGADPLVFAETDSRASARQKARASQEASLDAGIEATAESEIESASTADASFVFDWRNIQNTMKQFFRRRNAVKKRPNKFQLGTPPCCKFCPMGCPQFESKATFIEEEGILHAIPMSLIEEHMSANLSEWLHTEFSPSVQFLPADEEVANYDLHRIHAHHHKFRGIFKKAKGAVKKIVKKIKDLFKKKKKKLGGALDKLKDKAKDAVDGLKEKAEGAMDDLKEKAEGAVGDLKEKAGAALDAAKDAAAELDPAALAAKAEFAARKSGAIDKLKKGMQRVKDFFKNKAKKVVGLGKNLTAAAKKAVKKGFKVLKDFLKKKYGQIKGVVIPQAGSDLRNFQDRNNPPKMFDPPGADGKDPRCTKETFGKCCYLCPTTWSADSPPRNPKVHVKSAKLEELKKKTNNPQMRDPLRDKTPLTQHRDPLKITMEDIKTKQPAAVHALDAKDAPKEGFYWSVKGEAMKAPAPKPRDVANEGGYNSPMERAKNADVQLTGEQNNPPPHPAANSEAAASAPAMTAGESSSGE